MATTKPWQRHADNRDGRMPLMDHIRELRNRLLRAVIGLVVATVLGFIFFNPHTFTIAGTTWTTPGLWDVLKQPYCQLDNSHQLNPDKCSLGVFKVFEGFFLRLKVGLIVGVVASSPIWLYQIWAFVTPGLQHKERRWTVAFLGTAVPLFIGGSVLAYFVLSKGLALLLSFVPEGAVTLLGVGDYLGFVSKMLLVFGVAFELPLLVVMLNFAGVLTYERFARWRRMMWFAVFVFGAVATPGGDPFSMLALGLSMIVLFEIAGQIARFHDKRKAAREAASPLAQLSDDETSPLDLDDSNDLDGERR